MAAKFAKHLKKNELIVLDPSEHHYYQPLFTLVGGGTCNLEDARKNQRDVLPGNSTWIKDEAAEYDPKENTVGTKNGHLIKYDYLLIAVGLDLRYDKVGIISFTTCLFLNTFKISLKYDSYKRIIQLYTCFIMNFYVET